MAQLGWHINIDNCIACRACEAACKQEFNLPVGVRRRRIVLQEGSAAGRPWRRSITMSCNHCESPACRASCPADRYWKDEAVQADVDALRAHFGIAGDYTGLVLFRPSTSEDPNLGADCIGCKRCSASCPYGAPQYDEAADSMDKCTGCFHRQFPVAGSTLPLERQLPACTVTCTALALSFGDLADVDTWAQRRGGAPIQTTTSPPAGGVDLADPAYTNPSIRFTPQR